MKHLKVVDITGIAQSLAEGMVTHMPNLEKISVGKGKFTDQDIAGIASGSRKGWRVMDLSVASNVGGALRSVWAQAFSTLERLRSGDKSGLTDRDIVKALSSCPDLEYLEHLLIRTPSQAHSSHGFVSLLLRNSMLESQGSRGPTSRRAITPLRRHTLVKVWRSKVECTTDWHG